MPLRVALDVVRGGQPAEDVIVGAARARDLGDLHLALIGPREAIADALGTDVEHVAVWDSDPAGLHDTRRESGPDRPVVSLHTAGENEGTAALTELLRRHG